MAATRTTKTTTSSKSTKSTKTTKPTATTAKPAATAAKPAAAGVVAPELAVELKKKDLIDRVVKASGMKRGQVKPAVEATLAVLGDALQKGEDLNLEPMGKLKVKNEKDVGAAHIYSCRVRRKKQGATAAAPSKSEAPA